MATPRTTRTKQAEVQQPQVLTVEESVAAAAQPLPHDEETAQLAGRVRKKGLKLAENILDNAGSPPYTTGQLDIALKAIELYNAFK